MKTGYHRKKDSEGVKSDVISSAAEIASSGGVNSITVQNVADLAGITKGGLIHHYPSRQLLIDAVYEYLMEWLDEKLESFMAKDKKQYGRFTRAYVETIFQSNQPENKGLYALSASVITDKHLRILWADWMRQKLQEHKDTDSDQELEFVRLAADGAWLYLIDGDENLKGIAKKNLKSRLLKMINSRE